MLMSNELLLRNFTVFDGFFKYLTNLFSMCNGSLKRALRMPSLTLYNSYCYCYYYSFYYVRVIWFPMPIDTYFLSNFDENHLTRCVHWLRHYANWVIGQHGQ